MKIIKDLGDILPEAFFADCCRSRGYNYNEVLNFAVKVKNTINLRKLSVSNFIVIEADCGSRLELSMENSTMPLYGICCETLVVL